MAVRPIDANELYRIEKLLDTDIVRQDKVALNLLEQVLYDIQHVPTLTQPNETPPCYQPDGDGCAYQCYDGDDEPIDKCKECPLCYSDKQRHRTPPNEWAQVLEAINNEAVAYIEGGPYKNDLPGMELALKIDRLSRDFVRPPEGEEDT